MANFATVYDADGNAIKLDHVDARDYLATGRYTSAPADSVAVAAQAASDAAVRKAAAQVMIAEKDGVAIREASAPAKGGGKPRSKK